MKRSFPYIRITKKQEKTVQTGHPWIYEDEITEQSEQIENGSIVDVFGSKGQYLGSGLYSAESKIKVRILSRNANETFTDAFFERRVRYAVSYRHDVMEADWNACRLIHGEADGLPGLTVDRYENILVSEVLSYGMDQRKDVIYQALKKELASYGVRIDGIYERNEGALRKREGLEQYKGWYGQPAEPVLEITENGIRYLVDVENGQKTGFFLDQKYNRRVIRTLAKGRTVLDCCMHIGTFALNAAAAGAASVRAVDISDTAIASAKENAERNGLSNVMDFVQADVFDFLKNALDVHEHYDMIILDPPAFTKSRKTYDNAYQGYLRMNTMAMRILPRGGYLATASCSHFMPTDSFRKMLSEAALQAGVSLRLIEERHAGFDHPVMMGIPETEYLKFFILQII
ncbi:MAG: class I SAM-dependent rRNA methyltransferase [Solobacterium sp.]|nr:class I SAM-dependent rRNA methyltransferase [Solobacterium sp.]